MERSHGRLCFARVGRPVDKLWQHRHRSFATLAVADVICSSHKIDVLIRRRAAFQQSKARPVEQECHQAPAHHQPPEDPRGLSRRENRGLGRCCGRWPPDQVVQAMANCMTRISG